MGLILVPMKIAVRGLQCRPRREHVYDDYGYDLVPVVVVVAMGDPRHQHRRPRRHYLRIDMSRISVPVD
jgi:hypothetical protein